MFLLESERLILRAWTQSDMPLLYQLCNDPEVMRYFPNTLTEVETESFLQRLMDMYEHRGYTYFACERKDSGAFIGFIGLAYQAYESPCTPAVDIGWRLLPAAWGKGYATEGAKACLDFAFNELALEKVVAVCSKINTDSERVMQRIGMVKGGAFEHPKLDGDVRLQSCIWYEMQNRQI